MNRAPLRFPRTMAEAFKDASYADPIECYRPSFLASRWVWLGGLASLAVWFLLGLVVM